MCSYGSQMVFTSITRERVMLMMLGIFKYDESCCNMEGPPNGVRFESSTHI